MPIADSSSLCSPIHAYLQNLHEKYAGLHNGEVANYIPELSHANPNWFGICLATTDGHVYEVGESRQTFTIQSISKRFVYGLALEDKGKDTVLGKIGVEPTGDAFNSISLYPDSGRPLNPMINAGAIAATGMISGDNPAIKLRRLVQMLSRYCGRRVNWINECMNRNAARGIATGPLAICCAISTFSTMIRRLPLISIFGNARSW